MSSAFDLKTKKSQSQQGTQWGRLRHGGSWAQLYRSLWKDDIRWHYMHNVMAPQIYRDTNEKVSCKALYNEARRVDQARQANGDNDLLALHLCGKLVGQLSQTKCENLRKRHRGPLPFPDDHEDFSCSGAKYRYVWKAAEAFYDGTLLRLNIPVPDDVMVIILTQDWVFRLADHFLRLVTSIGGGGSSDELKRTKKELNHELERIDRNPNEPIKWTPRRTRFMLERFTKRAGGRIPTLKQLKEWNPMSGLEKAFKLHYPEIFLAASEGRDISMEDLGLIVPPAINLPECAIDEYGEVAAPPPISSVKVPDREAGADSSKLVDEGDDKSAPFPIMLAEAVDATKMKKGESSPSRDSLKRERSPPRRNVERRPHKRHKSNPHVSDTDGFAMPPWINNEDVSTMMSLAAAIPTGSLVDLPPTLEMNLATRLLMLRDRRWPTRHAKPDSEDIGIFAFGEPSVQIGELAEVR